MRITPLDLLLGTPRLQRRIDGERALLTRDLDSVRENAGQLRIGIARKATSLPALAAAVASGFVAAKLARAPRRVVVAQADEPVDARRRDGSAVLDTAISLAGQFLMPMVFGWIQSRFAPQPEPRPEPEPQEDSPTGP
jgi:hypothetical protein